MERHRFLIHGSVHGITEEAAAHFRRFERAGGRVDVLPGQRDALVSYDGDGDGVESMIHILERVGESAESTQGVITFGWSHQEPSHLHVGGVKQGSAHSLWDALKSIHLKSWLDKKLHQDPQPD
ncbi:conserved protein of unknown function [Acidithiobacillus ferrivorans]|uniref:Uncharacterized protein n=1 Tax=Acidithiobacillus ferrivorans TaxID=160808 RepID=A0A060UZR0_9PROT|nr:hypothetical protein [Acidithiobacillus ferrivorans]CDQ12138.1 conserved hypothetical protein [Acidithiobacillus ferrivorans]SMH64734.1 conserved protein of unknown function [Acidithiobacillus ferrivorans]